MVDLNKIVELIENLDAKLDNLSSSDKHLEVFKRTQSRLFEMTKRT